MLVDGLSHTGTAGPHPARTSHCHTCNLDHIAPTRHSVVRTTLHLYIVSHLRAIALYWPSGPCRTYTSRSCTCEPNLIQPVRGLFATATRTNSHLYVSPLRLRSGPRPTYTSRCCICNLDRPPPLRCTVEPAAGTTSRTCDLLSQPAAQPRSHHHLPTLAPPIPPCPLAQHLSAAPPNTSEQPAVPAGGSLIP